MIVTNREIYLDNSATTKVSNAAADRVYDMLVNTYGNPSSLHTKGLEAQHIVEGARDITAKSLGADSREIYFTSGGTEGNNLAVIGAALRRRKTGNRIVTTAAEHSSVIEACRYLEQQGFEVIYLPTDRYGAVSEESIAEAVDENTVLVSVMYVNNELGTIQPVEKIRRILKRKNSRAVFHTVAVQAFGKIPVRAGKLNADIITVSGHKIHAPKGIGALYIKKGTLITPRQFGGEQQSKIRPGTEASALIAGFGQAVSEIDLDKISVISELNAYLRERLSEIEGIVINSPDNALEYVINFSVRGKKSETIVHFLAERGIYVSSGSACAKGKQSYVLKAAGIEKELSDTAIRVSFSKYNTKQDVDALTEAIICAKGIIADI